MQVLLKALDWVWSLRVLTGYRNKIARFALWAIPSYVAISTSQEVIEGGLDLPDLPLWLVVGLTAWFAKKIKDFVKEHKE